MGLACLIVALGFIFEVSPVTSIWPLRVTHLTYVFIGSVVLAFAAPVLWIAWTGDAAAAAGAAMTATVAMAGFAVVLLPRIGGDLRLGAYGAAAAALGVVGLAVVRWSIRKPFHDRRPTPPLVRLALAGFTIALIVAGAAIVLGAENLLPWKIDRENSALVGWIFLSDAAYFAYGVAVPEWANAGGQLMAFAAYDVALLPPLVAHLSTVVPEQRTSLYVYIAVLVVSLGVAAYAFLVEPDTRLIGQRVSTPHA